VLNPAISERSEGTSPLPGKFRRAFFHIQGRIEKLAIEQRRRNPRGTDKGYNSILQNSWKSTRLAFLFENQGWHLSMAGPFC
jgi:hypothetical protein